MNMMIGLDLSALRLPALLLVVQLHTTAADGHSMHCWVLCRVCVGHIRYDILYKQDVGTEDVFLGLSDVDPSSTSCNFIVIKIMFPGNKIKDIDLDVTETKIVAQSPTLCVLREPPASIQRLTPVDFA